MYKQKILQDYNITTAVEQLLPRTALLAEYAYTIQYFRMGHCV